MKILFIDDEKKRNEFLVADLRQHYDMHIDWVRDVKALFENTSYNYDAIILDIMLPQDDSFTSEEKKKSLNGLATGLVLLERIRKNNEKIPILIYSARGDIQDFISNIRNVSFLQKPKDPEIIKDELSNLIKKSR
jgi:DNA-binding response OmpR family regulator